MIRLITFDLWNTIVSGSESSALRLKRIAFIRDILHELNKDADDTMIAEALTHSWDHFMREWNGRHYTPTTKALTAKVFQFLNVRPDQDAFCRTMEFMASSLIHADNKLVEGIDELLGELGNHYSLAVISDTGFTPGRYLRVLLKQLGVYRHFSFFAFSDEMGVSKPDIRIFMHTMNYFNIRPEEALHIGDLLSTDITGADRAGMHSVHFKKEQYRDELVDNVKPTFETHDAHEIPGFVSSI